MIELKAIHFRLDYQLAFDHHAYQYTLGFG